MNNKQNQIAERITYLMHRMRLNQKQFADLLGVTQPAVSKYLKVRIPPPLVLLKLARVSSTTIEWILSGEKDSSSLKVAEPSAIYTASLRLNEKIRQLPSPLQKHIENLVDSLLQTLRTASDKNPDIGQTE